jgi:hypothetical protein
MHNRLELEFKNTYLQPALQLKDELASRLRKIGILEPPQKTNFGAKTRIIAFDGILAGPNPIADAADTLEMQARRLP